MEENKQTTFSERVIRLALMVPSGMVTTYGRIAKAAGGGGQASRSVTAILGKAYMAGEKNIPFHRIVYSDGTAWLDGFHAPKRKALYKQEKIVLDKKGRIVDFYDKLFEYK